MQAALATNIGLVEDGYRSWFKDLKRILKFCNLEHLFYTSDYREIEYQIYNIKKRLKTMFIDKWKVDKLGFNNNSKLELFTSLKEDFGCSSYLLESKIPSFSMAITRLRISAHKFPIETGRYLNTPREERVCPLGCRKIGDELHYLTQCTHPFICDIRSKFIDNISKKYPGFPLLDSNEQCKLILNPVDPQTLNDVGAFCCKVQNMFIELT